MYPSPEHTWRPGARLFYWSCAIAVTLVWLTPIMLLLLTALKSNVQINTEQGAKFTLPSPLMPEGFMTILGSSSFWTSILYSFMVVLPVVCIAVGFATVAGYVLAKHKFPGRTWLFAIFVAGNFVPFQVLTFPVLRMMQDLGFGDWSPYNSLWALIIFHGAFQTGFCVFFMRNFIAALPSELIEAARMEGANEFQVFSKIILPLLRPALAALGLLIFTFVWNDFYWSLVLTQGDLMLVPTQLVNLARGQWQNQWNVMAGGSIIVALPPLVFFFFLQRQFVAGLTLGAQKG
ncbi:carbohydrate ABC transporter permease [Alphaproteobacteria bacterium]|nr:carbohydrate ABC transporter permease [Alphaproteobacteria bacterium]